jgi:hypothetical protein
MRATAGSSNPRRSACASASHSSSSSTICRARTSAAEGRAAASALFQGTADRTQDEACGALSALGTWRPRTGRKAAMSSDQADRCAALGDHVAAPCVLANSGSCA